MDAMLILKGAALLFVVSIFLSLSASALEKLGDAEVNSPAGCFLHGLLNLILVPIIFFATIGVVLGALYLINTYGG